MTQTNSFKTGITFQNKFVYRMRKALLLKLLELKMQFTISLSKNMLVGTYIMNCSPLAKCQY